MLASPGDCSRGVWRCAAAAVLAVGFGACSGEEGAAFGSASDCTVLAAGDLATLDADVHVLASGDALGGGAGSLSPALLPDAGDVYWYDAHASVFVERQGDGRVVELLHGEPPTETQHDVGLGLATNADRLFVGYGKRYNDAIDYFALEYDPPGRLLSISKRDGQAEVLLESADHWMAPITADAERVIVFAAGYDDGAYGAGYYQVPLAAPRLEPLPLSGAALASFSGGQLVGDQVYWVNYYPRRLVRAGFDDLVPEELMDVPSDTSITVGPGYTMSEEYVVSSDYHYTRDFVVRDDSGCRAVKGPRGDSVVGIALDPEYAYWTGGEGSWINSTPPNAVDLTRIDLESGALTRLNMPGFTPNAYLFLVGHDETRLFLYSDGTLASARKP